MRFSLAVFVALILASNLSAQTAADAHNSAPVLAKAQARLYFEPVASSAHSPAQFLSRGPGYIFFASPDGITMELQSPEKTASTSPVREATETSSLALRMQFKGANADPKIEAEGPLEGVSNYLIGNDPSRWRTAIPHFARIRYHNLYPHIDLVVYGSAQGIEYDLIVRRGGDPSKIAFAIAGAQQIRVDETGNLIIKTAAGELWQPPMVAYSLLQGRRIPAKVMYTRLAQNEIGFRVAHNDPLRTLVIDPVLRYSTLIGGSGFDAGEAIAVDSSNHAYIAGTTASADFPTTAGVLQRSSSTQVAFVSKLGFDGSGLIYSTFVGGTSGRNVAFGIKVDSAGNAFVTGLTESPDFPTTAGAFQTGLHGSNDAFVFKLTPGGAHLSYSTLLGGAQGDFASGIATDAAGNAYVTGATGSSDFPTTPAAISRTLNGASDAFITKLNATGTNLVYSTYFGGSSSDGAVAIALDSANNAYITGTTISSDFPVTPGAAQTTFGGGAETGDYFVAKLNPGGTAAVYSTYVGGTSDEGSEGGGGIAVDASGNAFITGDTFSADFPTTAGAFQKTGACGPFVTKVNPSGTAFAYSTRLTGSNGDCQTGHGIAVDPSGNAYVIGTTGSTDFPIREAFDSLLTGPFIEQGQHDAFVSKLNPAGSALLWSSYLGGTGVFDEGTAITLDKDRNVYVTGTASSSDFPTTQNAFQKTANSAEDAFVAKIIPLCALSRTNPSATICTPSAGSAVSSPVTIIAGTTDTTPVKLLQIYVDGKKQFEAALSAVDVSLPLTAGSHRITAQAFDTSNRIFKQSITVTVH